MPHLPQQNVFLGVPLILMPEEVVLLVEKQIAVIVDDASAHHVPSLAEKAAYNQERRLEQQMSSAQQGGPKGDAASRKALSEEAILKRKQREARRAAILATSEVASEMNEHGALQAQGAESSTTPLSGAGATGAYMVKIPTSSTPLPWYRASEHAYSTIAEAKEADVWSYPSSLMERARCGVFRVLWEKGYYMGCGIKFGGEFLVYPGDPLRYHSHFVVSVLESDKAVLRPMEIVAHGRLSTATKKAHTFAAWDEEKQDADIFSIEWAGFG